MTRPVHKSRLRKSLLITLSTAASLAAVLLFYLAFTDPVIDAAPWDPPAPQPLVNPQQMDGSWRRLMWAAEDIAIGVDSRIYGGLDGPGIGTIGVIPDNSTIPLHIPQIFATVGGRALGIVFDYDGSLLVCNHPLGLQRISPTGEVTLLTNTAENQPIHFANDLAVTSGGVIYFSDSSDTYHLANGFPPPHGAYDMLEARPRGRLLRYDPRDGSTAVLARDLYFPNGVALSADESTVLFCETFRYRVRRLDLATGNITTVIDNLPGYPDGLNRDAETGLFWIAMGVRRSALGDWAQRHPWLKNQVTKFPQSWWQRISSEAILIAIDEQGSVKHTLHDPTASAGLVTNAVPHGDHLYLGNLDGDHVLRLDKPSE